MGIKEAIAEFKRAASETERFDVYMLGECVGSATSSSYLEDDTDVALYYNFYPRAPKGIFPIGDIAVDFWHGEVYPFEEDKDGIVTINDKDPVNLIEAISKEL